MNRERLSGAPARPLASVSFGLLVLLAAPAGRAQDLEPQAYANAPVGVNILVVDLSHADGEIATDTSLPIDDAELATRSAVLGYVRTLGIFGRGGKLSVVLPYVSLSGSARVAGEERDRSVTGLGDPRVRLAVNLYGGPALSPAGFAGYQQDLVIGASLRVTAPLGQYDSDRAVNIGTNRWSFKPELGVSKTWWRGRVTTELAGGAAFHTDNRDFLGATREQDPLYSLQAHVVYRFPRGSWVALDGTYYTGGRTRVDGRSGDDRQGNSRAGVTFSLPITRRQSIKLHASTGISARTGGDFDLLGIAWQLQWGPDL